MTAIGHRRHDEAEARRRAEAFAAGLKRGTHHTEHTREVQVVEQHVPGEVLDAVAAIGAAVHDIQQRLETQSKRLYEIDQLQADLETQSKRLHEIDQLQADHDALVQSLQAVGQLAEALKRE